jgi:hypothetical protein
VTYYRAVFVEILTRHFGDDPELLEHFMPGYGAAAGRNPSDFELLDFIV